MRAKIRRFHQQTAANRTKHVDLQEWREETFDMSLELLRPVLEPNLLSHFIAEKALCLFCREFIMFYRELIVFCRDVSFDCKFILFSRELKFVLP